MMDYPGKKTFLSVLLCSFFAVAGASAVLAQPTQLTKELLGEKANALLNAGKRAEAIELVDAYPQYAHETDVLYVKSVAYGELREFKKADVYFQEQFEIFRSNGDSARTEAGEIRSGNPETKEYLDQALLMFDAALVSYGTADLINSLRSAVFEKAGVPAAGRDPKNLTGYDEMLRLYIDTEIETGWLQLKVNHSKEALADFNKAIELDGKSAAAYRGRAATYRKLNKIALARADEIKVKKLNGK